MQQCFDLLDDIEANLHRFRKLRKMLAKKFHRRLSSYLIINELIFCEKINCHLLFQTVYFFCCLWNNCSYSALDN